MDDRIPNTALTDAAALMKQRAQELDELLRVTNKVGMTPDVMRSTADLLEVVAQDAGTSSLTHLRARLLAKTYLEANR